MSATHSPMGYRWDAAIVGGVANNVHRITPEVKRDAHGSYLSGDRSVAMAQAIAADIRRRALTEPGYLDHWKAGAASARQAQGDQEDGSYPLRHRHGERSVRDQP